MKGWTVKPRHGCQQWIRLGAVKLPLELCREVGLSRKSFFMDIGAYAEQRGKGGNPFPSHTPSHRHWVRNCHREQELCLLGFKRERSCLFLFPRGDAGGNP